MVTFRAEAADPDGDPIELEWTGCAAGSLPVAECVIRAPGDYRATVTARDGKGGVATAFRPVAGLNQPPVIRFGGSPPDPAPSDRRYFFAGRQPTDPDGDEDENRLCSRRTLTVSGPCTASIGLCGGAGDAFDLDLHTTTGPGTCTVETTTRDSWGRVGLDRLVFRVKSPE